MTSILLGLAIIFLALAVLVKAHELSDRIDRASRQIISLGEIAIQVTACNDKQNQCLKAICDTQDASIQTIASKVSRAEVAMVVREELSRVIN